MTHYQQVPPPPPVATTSPAGGASAAVPPVVSSTAQQYLDRNKLYDLDEIIENYKVIGFTKNALLIENPSGVREFAAIDEKEPKPRLDTELGYLGATEFLLSLREEYNPDLAGEAGIEKYMEMRNDAQVRASLRIAKTPVIAARWFVEPARPLDGEPTEADLKAARFIEYLLFDYMTETWPALLQEALNMLDYGRYSFEKVFTRVKFEGENLIGWSKFSPRHPIEEVEWVYDAKGGPKELRTKHETKEYIRIPIEKLAVFTFDKEGGDFRGRSLLRSVYKHWFYKENLYKIDAIQKERHAIGIPVIMLPPGWTQHDKRAAENIGMSLRTNENAYVVLPPLWELTFAELRGHHVNVLDSITHHGTMIYENVVAHFIKDVGSSRENTQNTDFFLKGSQFIANYIASVMNLYCIPQIIKWNWNIKSGEVSGFPKLRARRIGDFTDWRTLSFALRNLAGMAAVTPDEPMEEWIREEMDLPRMDPSTAREIETPQNSARPPKPSPPKQSRAGNMRNGPSSRQGQDRTGG